MVEMAWKEVELTVSMIGSPGDGVEMMVLVIILSRRIHALPTSMSSTV